MKRVRATSMLAALSVLLLPLLVGSAWAQVTSPRGQELSQEHVAGVAEAKITLRVTAGPSTLRVSDRFVLRLSANVPVGYQVQWPEVASLPGWTVASVVAGREGQEETFTITLDPFLAGSKNVPELVVRAVRLDGEVVQVRTSAIQAEVGSVAENTADATTALEPARPPVPLPMEKPDRTATSVAVGLIGLTLVIIAAATVNYIRRRCFARLQDPRAQMRRELDACRALVSSAPQAATDRLCAAVRAYGQRVLEIPAMSFVAQERDSVAGSNSSPAGQACVQLLVDLETARFSPAATFEPQSLIARAEALLGTDVQVRLVQETKEGAAA